MSRRLLYVMNVDWDWAKQRPHYIAEHLSDIYDVVVIYPYSWCRKSLARNDRKKVRLSPFFRLPLGGRFGFIRTLNRHILRVAARLLIRWHRPDIVWISSPELFEYLPKEIPGKLIYDCMDDVLAFPSNTPRRNSLHVLESELVGASTHVFCSSKNLCDKLLARAGHPEKYTVVHNAFEPSAFREGAQNMKPEKVPGTAILGYVGTISSWLDFEALARVVDEFDSVEIHLLGPIENLGMALPQHERIKYLGAVRHEDIQASVSGFDVLMMPFRVTELVQSVDPVKLYEYVFFDKPIVSVRYAEIERFSDFVDFYTNHDDLARILDRYLRDGFRKKYSDDKRRQFIASNTWSDRVGLIQRKLEGVGLCN